MRNLASALAFLAASTAFLAVPAASAQGPAESLYGLQLNIDPQPIQLRVGDTLSIPLFVQDLSKDSTASQLGPGVPQSGLQHRVTFRVEYLSPETRGWSVLTPPALNTRGGETVETVFRVGLTQFVQELRLEFRIVATMRTQGGEFQADLNATAFTFGLESFTLLGGPPLQVGPDDVTNVIVRVRNNALLPRAFDIRIVSNPCGLDVAKANNNLVAPLTTEEIPMTVLAPAKRFWYQGADCSLGVEVSPSDNPLSTKSAILVITVDGFYVAPEWVFWSLVLLAALAVLVLLILRRKARIEEEILGKPQKPWTIPVEKLYLKRLKEKDARAWYVVRHFLMEEEYRSALLWYRDYKRATRGARKKERLILGQEKAYDAWKRRWEARIAAPLEAAVRREARLQRVLDRKARRRHRKALRKHRALTSRMRKAHEAQAARAGAKWQREARRAGKKGLAPPPRPRLDAPDYPAEPRPGKAALADHRYGKRAARFRRRMVRRQGDLEVRFERRDARRLARLRRKVQRMARRLDDPAFVAEHPLLQGS